MKLKQYLTELKVEIKRNPQTGWKTYNLKGNDKVQAVHEYIIKTHSFLNDDNHTWKPKTSKVKFGGKTTTHTHVVIYKKNGSKWFSVEYK